MALRLPEIMQTIEGAKAAGVIKKYAIGGAIGAMFYIEPTSTYDLDIFYIPSDEDAKSTLLSVGGLYSYMGARGHRPHGEHIGIFGMPVQFLPTEGPGSLSEEAVENSVVRAMDKDGNVKAPVLTPEYLIALMVKLGRLRDKVRTAAMLQQAKVDRDKLSDILSRHGLSAKWDALVKEGIENV